MGAGITGKDGTVTLKGGAVAHMRNFSLDETADNQVYCDSGSGGNKQTAEGNKGWTGSIDIYLDAGAFYSQCTVGEKVACVFNTGAASKSGNCRVDSISGITVDVEGSGMVSCTINVTGDGALS